MRWWWIFVPIAALGFFGFRSPSSPPATPMPPTPFGPPPDGMQVWSLGASSGSWCGLPLVRRCTENFGVQVLDLGELGAGELVWGWTPPGDLRAAGRYGKQLIADVEYRPVVPAAPASAWAGYEVDEADAVAAQVMGVTSHGFVPPGLRAVMKRFAAAGCVGFPQVYDSDASTEPRKFLRTCINSWQNAGFTMIVPLLGASAGLPHLLAWLDECRTLGVTSHLWSLQRLQERDVTCADIGLG